MPIFEYSAFDAAGKTKRGVLLADSPRSARDSLRTEGLVVGDLRARLDRNKAKSVPLGSWRKSSIRWAEAAHELATLLSGGIPLLKALDTVAAQSSGGFQAVLLDVRDQVAAGASFAQALARHPQVFDELSVRLVEVGENSGDLEQALDRLAAFKLSWHQLRDQVTSALIYPLFVFSFGLSATVFLMTFVMPPLLENLRETVPVLPWPTRVVKAGSDLLLNYGLLVGLALLAVLIVAAATIRSSRGRQLLDSFALRMPLFGPLATKQCVSRMSMILSTLLESGVPLADAMELAAQSMGNRVLRSVLLDCRKSLLAGRSLSVALSETAVMPPLVIEIFAVGVESGKLESLLARLAVDYERQVQRTTARLSAVLEPVLILALSVMIGLVLLAIILPILEAGNVAM